MLCCLRCRTMLWISERSPPLDGVEDGMGLVPAGRDPATPISRHADDLATCRRCRRAPQAPYRCCEKRNKKTKNQKTPKNRGLRKPKKTPKKNTKVHFLLAYSSSRWGARARTGLERVGIIPARGTGQANASECPPTCSLSLIHPHIDTHTDDAHTDTHIHTHRRRQTCSGD